MGGDEKEVQRGGGVNKDEKEVIKLEKVLVKERKEIKERESE